MYINVVSRLLLYLLVIVLYLLGSNFILFIIYDKLTTHYFTVDNILDAKIRYV